MNIAILNSGDLIPFFSYARGPVESKNLTPAMCVIFQEGPIVLNSA